MRRSSRNLNKPATQMLSGSPRGPKVRAEKLSDCDAPKPDPRDAHRVKRELPEEEDEGDETFSATSAKKRRVARSSSRAVNGNGKAPVHERLFGPRGSDRPPPHIAVPPARAHDADYHRPQLLDNRKGRTSLLAWYDSVSTARSMPWRKAWIDSRSSPLNDPELRQKLERRAYEVWISEIMLQQTRVAVVIDYWNRWMAKWPTIHDLAAADADDVLAAWRGLGYYSRATRIHEAAKLVVGDGDMRGLLPASANELAAKVPGVGPYTAGAISAIVFGHAASMVDGNVLRVLSRQLGVYGDVKTDKSVIDLLRAAADSLAKAVAGDTERDEVIDRAGEMVSDRPGRWGQALMELGSTICTPKPDCAACPISSTCLAYAEGLQLAGWKGLVPKKSLPPITNNVLDIEDACSLCKPFEEFSEAEGDEESEKPSASMAANGAKKPRPQRQTNLSSFFTDSSSTSKHKKALESPSTPSNSAIEVIASHARKFPVKKAKKAVREEETLVCAVRCNDGRYLIHRRPQKGLLAGLWEFPSYILAEDHKNTKQSRKNDAQDYVKSLLDKEPSAASRLKHVGELGSVPWLFSHLKLTMHVHAFELEDEAHSVSDSSQNRWSDTLDDESMGTGMRKCWSLVKEALGC
ncbi:DNA glycosylase [Xylariaceae sp. FL0016]|nr:DNA glycosylase [Xylariaceae sp. FL0016]